MGSSLIGYPMALLTALAIAWDSALYRSLTHLFCAIGPIGIIGFNNYMIWTSGTSKGTRKFVVKQCRVEDLHRFP